MFDAQPDRKGFGFDFDAACMKCRKCVARTVPRRQNQVIARDARTIRQYDSREISCTVPVFDLEVVDPALKAIFTSERFDRGAQMLDHAYQPKGAYMGMRLGENLL